MPIVHLESNTADSFPDGSYCPIGLYNPEAARAEWLSPDCILGANGLPHGPVVISRSHHGLCLKVRESNRYDDSDFYMLVWNQEKGEPEEIKFASTMYWCEPCFGSAVDATPAVIDAYAAWQEKQLIARRKQQRVDEAKRLRDLRAAMKAAATKNGVPYLALVRLRAQSLHQFSMAMWLLTGKFRNAFKLSVREQLCSWLRDPNPNYATPFSPKVAQYLGFYTGPGADRLRH